MGKLTDPEIRAALKQSLVRRANAPVVTFEEFHVCRSNAIADIVAVYKLLHCYEIKGETDSIMRLARQAIYYDQAFPLITLVTTKNHLARAIDVAPSHWGVMLASNKKSGEIIFSSTRGAKRNPAYRPEILLQSLWKSELISILGQDERKAAKINRQNLADLIMSGRTKESVNDEIGSALVRRKFLGVNLDSQGPCM